MEEGEKDQKSQRESISAANQYFQYVLRPLHKVVHSSCDGCTRSVHDEVCQKSQQGLGEAHEVSPSSQKLLTIDGFSEERQSVLFFFRDVASERQPHGHTESVKWTQRVLKKKHMKLGGKGVAGYFRRRNWGESNQNTLHVCIKFSNNKTLLFKKFI